MRPPRIRTDASNAFAHNTMAVRVPRIIDAVRERNPHYPSDVHDALARLRDALAEGQRVPGLADSAPHAESWLGALAARDGATWLDTDWFFAETYAYRQIVEHVRYWQAAQDPFLSNKTEEYASAQHHEAFASALELANAGSREERLFALLGAALFANRIDLSYAASREHGSSATSDDFLIDERAHAVTATLRGSGPLHIVADNAGSELTLDLVLADFAVTELEAKVVLHLKVHPTFVSDATVTDVRRFVREPGLFQANPAMRACLARLSAALDRGAIELLPHPFWNGPESLWDLPADLLRHVSSARILILKGDANYRRAVGDAIWPPATPFERVLAYFPASLLALRTLKSDPIVGISARQSDALDRIDPSWRVNGRRGVASFSDRA